MGDLEKRLEEAQRALEARVDQAEIAVDRDLPLQRRVPIPPSVVRYILGCVIIGVWATCVVGTALYLIFCSKASPQERITNLLELLKVAVLPIVIFVMGYYFATSKPS